MARGQRLTPAVIRRIVDLGRQGWSYRRIASEVNTTISVISEYLTQWKRDPDSLRLLWGETLEADHEYQAEVRRLLLADPAYLHEARGWLVHPAMNVGWALQDEHREVLLTAFRGFGKSVAWGETRVIQQILRSAEAYRARSRGESHPVSWIPNYSCAYISSVPEQAIPHGRNIRQFLEDRRIVEIFGQFEGDSVWTDQAFVVRQRDRQVADPTVLCGGVFESGWTGKHPDEIIFDDVVSQTNVSTAGRLRSLDQRLMITIEGICRPETRRSWVNTPYAWGDPIARRIRAHEGKGAPEDKIPSLILRAVQTGAAGEIMSAWPERFPLYTSRSGGVVVQGLLERRAQMDRVAPGAFASQYQMDTSQLENRTLDATKVSVIPLERVPQRVRERPLQLFDAAWSESPTRRSDFSAMATGAFDWETGNFYLLRCVRCRRSPSETAAFIRAEHDFGPETGLWGPSKRVFVEKTNLYRDKVEGLLREITGIPWRTYVPRRSKEDRAYPLEHLLESGRFFAAEGAWLHESRPGEMDGFLDELDAFPSTDFDDRVDAVASLVVRLQRERRAAKGAPVPDESVGVCGQQTVAKKDTPKQAPPAKMAAAGTFKLRRE